MKEKIKELQDLLFGKQIKHKSSVGPKFYNVKTVVERKFRIVIETKELKTFTETLETIDFLMNFIEIVSDSEIATNEVNFLHQDEPVKTDLPLKKMAFVAPETTKNVSEGLMSIFNDLTSKSNVSDADLKKYKAVSDIAGKIIDIEKVKLGYLALNYR